MRSKSKVLEISASQNEPSDIEALLNIWLRRGWQLIQVTSVANKIYAILVKEVSQ